MLWQEQREKGQQWLVVWENTPVKHCIRVITVSRKYVLRVRLDTCIDQSEFQSGQYNSGRSGTVNHILFM